MLEQWQQGPPSVYKYVWHKQLLRADKALWLKAAEDTWSNVQSKGGAKPVYEAIQRWSVHPEVQYHMIPSPGGSASSSTTPRAASMNTSSTPAPKPVVEDNDLKGLKGRRKAKEKER